MNFRDVCKQSVTNGLESDSGYTSDSDSSAVEIIENSNSQQKPQSISSTSDGPWSDIVELKNDLDDEVFKKCSSDTAKLLKTGVMYNSQIKRIISIWPKLFS